MLLDDLANGGESEAIALQACREKNGSKIRSVVA